jgi:hypothetical protein
MYNINVYKGEIFVYRSDHPWDVIRNNRAIHVFLNTKYDILVKCDIDQWYPGDYFTKMVPLVEDYKVIGPVIYDRQFHNNYAPLVTEGPGGPWIDMTNESGIHKFPYTHTNNFYAREALEAVDPPWYEARLSSDGLHRANHVDCDFQDSLREAGYEVYTNCDMTVEHIVRARINKEYYRNRVHLQRQMGGKQ